MYGIRLNNTKTLFNKKILKTFISCSWSFLKPIERLIEFVYMVRIFLIFKSQRLFHIDFLFDRFIQKDTLDVYLIKLKIMMSSIDK
jgi:hypothetical protein